MHSFGLQALPLIHFYSSSDIHMLAHSPVNILLQKNKHKNLQIVEGDEHKQSHLLHYYQDRIGQELYL